MALPKLLERLSPSTSPRPVAPALVTPPPAWQRAAQTFATRAADKLQSTDAFRHGGYLRDRGFSHETIVSLGLGYASEPAVFERSVLGLPDTRHVSAVGPTRLEFHAGIVMPVRVDGALMGVMSRRTSLDTVTCPNCRGLRFGPGRCRCGSSLPRYLVAVGSRPALYPLDQLRDQETCLLVGDPLTAALVSQHGADLKTTALGWTGDRAPTADDLAPYVPALSRVKLFLALETDSTAAKLAEAIAQLLPTRIETARLPGVLHAENVPGWNVREIDIFGWLAREILRVGPEDPKARA